MSSFSCHPCLLPKLTIAIDLLGVGGLSEPVACLCTEMEPCVSSMDVLYELYAGLQTDTYWLEWKLLPKKIFRDYICTLVFLLLAPPTCSLTVHILYFRMTSCIWSSNWPCLQLEIYWWQISRRLFYNGGLWEECFLGLRGFFCCSIVSGRWD